MISIEEARAEAEQTGQPAARYANTRRILDNAETELLQYRPYGLDRPPGLKRWGASADIQEQETIARLGLFPFSEVNPVLHVIIELGRCGFGDIHVKVTPAPALCCRPDHDHTEYQEVQGVVDPSRNS
jgi:hypothetical protein